MHCLISSSLPPLPACHSLFNMGWTNTFFFIALLGVAGAQISDPLQYVNQLIGSSNGGNVFSGATLPYGMAKAVADTNSASNQGGFTTDNSNITGFSSMHDSGTG